MKQELLKEGEDEAHKLEKNDLDVEHKSGTSSAEADIESEAGL